jgi:hypothetical protein
MYRASVGFQQSLVDPLLRLQQLYQFRMAVLAALITSTIFINSLESRPD